MWPVPALPRKQHDARAIPTSLRRRQHPRPMPAAAVRRELTEQFRSIKRERDEESTGLSLGGAKHQKVKQEKDEDGRQLGETAPAEDCSELKDGDLSLVDSDTFIR